MYKDLSLLQRLGALFIYVALLFVVSGLVTGIWFPDGTGRTLWLLAAIGMLLFTRITAPYFTPPRDALANSLTNILLLATVNLGAVGAGLMTAVVAFRAIAIGFCTLVLFSAVTSIALYKAGTKAQPWLKQLGKIAYRLTSRLGRGEMLFTPAALISIVGFHQGEPLQQAWLIGIWSLLVFIEPVDLFLGALQDIKGVRERPTDLRAIGEVARVDHPNILRVRLRDDSTWHRNQTHIAVLPGQRQVEVLPLSMQTQGEEILGTGLCHCEPSGPLEGVSTGFVYYSTSLRPAEEALCEMTEGGDHAELIGFIVESSSVSQIRFEVAGEQALEEGMLVFSQLGEQRVYYQILDARTAEESFDQNPKGLHIAIAQQLGGLVPGKGFQKCGWLPFMNAPVFLAPTDASGEVIPAADGTFELGHVPNSAIPVIASLEEMFGYHTALLGATGTGKTELAYDLIRAAVQEGYKVICVDFTGEYQKRLHDLLPADLGLSKAESRTLQERLFEVETAKYGTVEKGTLETFIGAILPGMESQVSDFLQGEGGRVGIFELEEIANTKATLRATELYLSTVFRWARRTRTGDRILLVLEEAHTVIPETNLYGFDRVETAAVVGRMAQIALQGRKFGVGILLISQRTALVSKTLLSQCNTVICFAMHDETGIKYLGNVFDSEHVAAIPRMKALQGMAFGKGVYSDYPVLFEIPYDKEKKKASEALRHGLTTEEHPSHNTKQECEPPFLCDETPPEVFDAEPQMDVLEEEPPPEIFREAV